MYFLHEHPWSATSWNEPRVQELLKYPDVEVVKSDMCCFGMYQNTDAGDLFVKKPTGFMTNAPEIGKILSQECEGKHRHVHLLNGRAKKAEVYPDELCYNIFIHL